MEETKKILAIAIPTYNRVEDIKITLANFIEQIKENKLENFIEIVVSDNNSTDDTQEVMQSFINANPDLAIKYSKNDTNIGLRNIYNVSKLAKAKYVWLCGDDDTYRKNSVEKIYESLKSDVDFIFINHEASPEGIILKEIKTDTYLTNKSDLLAIIKNGPGFLTSTLFKSEIYEAIPTESYAWPHFERLLNFPQDMKSLIIAEPLIFINRPDINNWFSYNNTLTFGVDMFEHIVSSNLLKADKNLMISVYAENLKDHYIYYSRKYGQSENVDYNQLAQRTKDCRKTFGFNLQLFLIQKMFESKVYCRMIFKFNKFLAFCKSKNF